MPAIYEYYKRPYGISSSLLTHSLLDRILLFRNLTMRLHLLHLSFIRSFVCLFIRSFVIQDQFLSIHLTIEICINEMHLIAHSINIKIGSGAYHRIANKVFSAVIIFLSSIECIHF